MKSNIATLSIPCAVYTLSTKTFKIDITVNILK